MHESQGGLGGGGGGGEADKLFELNAYNVGVSKGVVTLQLPSHYF